MIENVASHIVQLAEEEILPRFRNLQPSENMTKEGGDAVTAADLEVERRLTPILKGLIPGSIVIGEEACEEDKSLLNRISENGDVWVIDPVDGTTHFALGEPPFGVMVAHIKNKETVRSWIYLPLENKMFTAEMGSGTYCNGTQLQCEIVNNKVLQAKYLHVTLKTGKLPEGLQENVEGRIDRFKSNIAGRLCAAADYTEILEGKLDGSLYYRTLPWDHVPGTLMIKEAGGVVQTFEGENVTPDRLTGGLIAARSPEVAEVVKKALFGLP